MHALSAEHLSELEYEHTANVLNQLGAGPFSISNGRRELAYSNGVLLVIESDERIYPRCADCGAVNPLPRFRGAINARLCATCARERVRRNAPRIRPKRSASRSAAQRALDATEAHRSA